MSLHTGILLAKQLRSVKGDIEEIDSQIVCDLPHTSDELLHLREIQRMYREIAVSLAGAIALYE